MLPPAVVVALAACHRDPVSTDTAAPPCTPPDPPEIEAVTTRSVTYVADPVAGAPLPKNPSWPDGLAEAEALGLGGQTEAPGEEWTLRDELAPGWTPPNAGRRSLWMTFHQTDAQIADSESPTRLAGADQIGVTQSAARPQELYAIHALDALIRRVNALAELAPVDFALATGDNADNNQRNELGWFTAVWDGQPVTPDSGERDTQVDVDCNDPIATFTPEGAAYPWYAVAGNHDVLVQGNFENDAFVEDALGDVAVGGTRDLSLPGGPITFVTPPDAERALLERSDIASIVLDSPSTPGPDGHGFSQQNVREDTLGWSVVPVDGVPVRLISVDANPSTIGQPELTAEERDTWLVPELTAAQAAGELVVLTSHYALGTVSIEGGGNLSGLLAGYPNVVLVIAGHSHVNRVLPFGPPDDPAGFWQIETSATVDWPNQGRLIEVVDNGDGTLSVIATMIDTPAPVGSLSARAGYLARIDLQSGWQSTGGEGGVLDRNVELVQRLPDGWSTSAGGKIRSTALP